MRRIETMERSFPPITAEDLQEIDEKLGDPHSENYTKLMVTLLKNGRLSRSILNVMSEDIVLSHNLEGGQSKKKLKAYPNFVRALLNAIALVEPSEPPEKALQKAMRCVKNLSCTKKKSTPAPDAEEPTTPLTPGTPELKF
ncbi:uncharacterized protein LOC119558932 [Drosophila subpulchrella]|uniref:uncharacterized protein LOC119558932 n=1 Tax=Drosophila subpulchrella TaxID=1486046 RepID=UPI0018A137BC|nr:uncharacterized protein LOC119558932 [Drosophila subpulchrella]